MQGLLLGLGDIIGNAFKAVLMAVVKPILELVIKWVVEPILTLLIKVIMYTIGAVLYVIGSFLLQLVDFVEVLFRALAGMESVSASGMSMSLSLDGGSGDILIQLIRHPDIQSAFVSMCVVGLFLLVVTTVFQIIKVEYTTEGAKNAKGPIFQKAFKGFANLMLLPLLVIFGIIFANQLLGLLDTATKGTGDNPTISGLIFVSSAGEAHYLKNEEPMDIEGDSWIGICLDGIGYGIIELLNGLFGGAWEEEEAVTTRLYEDEIDRIENDFISQKPGHRYYNIGEVSKYYNYAYINYLLLLFGAVFALKALFFSCFGMVIRLYKCAVLFIISPAIIGMTPINEGGLGKWRTAFIGQVLSAYGTILSLNLFFIIVRVLLSVEVNFVSSADNVMGNMLTDGFMTLLLKAIFVLAGCLLIEKFSKEIGAYFGAEDAMSAGKDMAGQVGDLAMKGVGAAAMVASGGAGLAMKAGKMAGGIAGKIGKSGVGQLVGKGAGALGGKIKQGATALKKSPFGTFVGNKIIGSKAKDGEKGHGLLGLAEGASGLAQKVGGAIGDAGAWIAGGQEAVDSRHLDDIRGDLKTTSRTRKRYGKELDELRAKGISEESIARKKKNGINLSADERRFEDRLASARQLKVQEKSLTARNKAASKYHAESEEAKIKAKGERSKHALNAISTVYGLGQDFKKKLPGMKYHDQIIKAGDSGSKALGDEFEAAHGSVEYMKGKKVQQLVEENPIFSRLMKSQNAMAAREVMKEASQEMKASIDGMARNIENTMRNLAQTINNYKDPNMRQQRMDSVFDSIRATGANIDRVKFDEMIAKGSEAKDAKELADAISISAKQDLKINFDEKAITDALNRAAKNGLTPEAIRKELQDLFKNMGKDGEAALMKIVQDAIVKVSGQIGGK